MAESSEQLTLDFKDYVDYRWGTVPEMSQFEQELAYVGLGIAGEAGEVADEIKKRLRTGGDQRDIKKLVLETGDVLFYLKRLWNIIGVEQDEVEYLIKRKLDERVKINQTEQGNA